MQLLYDSDNFIVVFNTINASEENPSPKIPRDGFEIVDKRVNKEVFLDGEWAMIFQKQIDAWHANIPHEEEVESVLDSYSSLAYVALNVH